MRLIFELRSNESLINVIRDCWGLFDLHIPVFLTQSKLRVYYCDSWLALNLSATGWDSVHSALWSSLSLRLTLPEKDYRKANQHDTFSSSRLLTLCSFFHSVPTATHSKPAATTTVFSGDAVRPRRSRPGGTLEVFSFSLHLLCLSHIVWRILNKSQLPSCQHLTSSVSSTLCILCKPWIFLWGRPPWQRPV